MRGHFVFVVSRITYIYMWVSNVTYFVIHCTYRACRTPNCPSKCTYRSLSADPPTNKHWDIQLVWYACNGLSSPLGLRFLCQMLDGQSTFAREIQRHDKMYYDQNCFDLIRFQRENNTKLLIVVEEIEKVSNFNHLDIVSCPLSTSLGFR